jgi:hypothetical protein
MKPAINPRINDDKTSRIKKARCIFRFEGMDYVAKVKIPERN